MTGRGGRKGEGVYQEEVVRIVTGRGGRRGKGVSERCANSDRKGRRMGRAVRIRIVRKSYANSNGGGGQESAVRRGERNVSHWKKLNSTR